MKKRFFCILLLIAIFVSNLAVVNAENSIVVVSQGCKASVVVGTTQKDASQLFDGKGNLVNNGADAWKITWGQTGYIQVDLEREYNLYEIKIHRTNQGHLKKNIPILASNDESFAEYETIGTTTATETKISNVNIWTSASLDSTNKYRYVRIQKNSGFDFYPAKIDVYAIKQPLGVDSITSGGIDTDTAVDITFNDYLKADMDTSSILVTNNGNKAEADITVLKDKLTISPKNTWKPGGIYKVTIPAGSVTGEDERVNAKEEVKYFAVSTDNLAITELDVTDDELKITAVNNSESDIDITIWNAKLSGNIVDGTISESTVTVTAGDEFKPTVSISENCAVYFLESVETMKNAIAPFINIEGAEEITVSTDKEIEAEYTDGYLTICGNAEADDASIFVTVGDKLKYDTVKAIAQTVVSDGKYAVKIPLSEDFESGEYNVWFADGAGTLKKAEEPPYILSTEDKESVASEIADMDASELEEYFEDSDNEKILSGVGIISDRPNKTTALYETIAELTLTGSYTEIAGAINEQIAIAVSKEKDIVYTVENYSEILGIDEENELFVYADENSLFDEATALIEDEYTTKEEFNEAMLNAFKLAIFQNAPSVEYAQEFSKEHNDLFEFDFDGDYADISKSNKKEVIREAMSGESLEEMQELFEEKATELKKSEKKKDSSGGSGGKKVSTPSNIGIVLPEVPISKAISFSDLSETHWAYNSVISLAEKGVVSGFDGKFMPDNNVTREEFVKLLVLAADISAEGEINFDDVSEDSWYYEYVNAAYNGNIVNGISDKLFGTGANITRQDMAVMIYNTCKSLGISFEAQNEISFADKQSIADYANVAVSSLYAEEIIKGKDNNMFDPLGNATRAEAAEIICRMLNLI